MSVKSRNSQFHRRVARLARRAVVVGMEADACYCIDAALDWVFDGITEQPDSRIAAVAADVVRRRMVLARGLGK